MRGRRAALLMLLAGAVVAPAHALAQRRRVDGAAMEAARRFLCPNGGAPVPGRRGRCTAPRGGGGLVAGGMAGWDAGLPPPDRRQAPCPEGTVAAAARDRPESTRCVPR